MVDQEPRHIDARTTRAFTPQTAQVPTELDSTSILRWMNAPLPPRVPALLHTCTESRHESLPHNKKFVSRFSSRNGLNPGLINPSVDILSIESFSISGLRVLFAGKADRTPEQESNRLFTAQAMFANVKHVESKVTCSHSSNAPYLTTQLDQFLNFKALKKLTLLINATDVVTEELEKSFGAKWDELWKGKTGMPELILKKDEAMNRYSELFEKERDEMETIEPSLFAIDGRSRCIRNDSPRDQEI